MVVTRQDIVDGLRRLGIGPGSIIVVHSSLKSFGHVDGGPEAVILALEETVTEDGLVIMPVHAYCLTRRPQTRPFDPATSPSETGAIPATFWKMPDVLRSRHPTHSTAAWGRRAAELLADHENRPPVGRDSPLHRAAQWGGGILQLGVGHGSNTTLHLAESLARVPYLDIPVREAWGTTALVRQPDGSVREVEAVGNERPGCSGGFAAMEPLLEQRGLTRETMIGPCLARLTPAMAMVEVAMAALAENPELLLCHRPECEHCVRSREVIARSRKRSAGAGGWFRQLLGRSGGEG